MDGAVDVETVFSRRGSAASRADHGQGLPDGAGAGPFVAAAYVRIQRGVSPGLRLRRPAGFLPDSDEKRPAVSEAPKGP